MMRDANGLQYFLIDHLGSTVAITDSNGTLTSQQRYLPFGGTRANVTAPNSPGTDFGYTGQRQLDAGMGGLMDYKARFYSPYINHFIQPDSLIPDPVNSQAWNRFSYVGNRSINLNDPTGHDPIPWSTFIIQPSAFIRLPILGGVDIGLVFAYDLRPVRSFVNQIKNIGSPESITKLPKQFGQFINNQNGGMLLQAGYSRGIEADIGATIAAIRTTDKMEDLAGTETLADGWNIHATGCWEGCAGAVLGKKYSTKNKYDTEGIAVGVGYGLEVGTDIVTTSDWIAWGSLSKKSCLQVPFIRKLMPKLSTGSCPH